MVRRIDLSEHPRQNTGLKDANGNFIKGVDMDFEMDLVNVPGTFKTRERFVVSNEFVHALLGQTWFEQVGAHFQNFPDNPRGGRRFALYPCPWSGRRASSGE